MDFRDPRYLIRVQWARAQGDRCVDGSLNDRDVYGQLCYWEAPKWHHSFMVIVPGIEFV